MAGQSISRVRTAGSAIVIGLWLSILLALHFWSSFYPSVRTWGIDYWSEIPAWIRLGIVCMFPLLLAPPLAQYIDRKLIPLGQRRLLGVIALIATAGMLYLLRSQGYAYGDGYSFRGLLADGRMPPLTGNLLLMAGDLWTHHILYRLVFAPLGATVETTYSVASMSAGVLSIIGVIRIARALCPHDTGNRWFLIAGALTSGSIALWFGHVEAYSLANAAILWSISFMLQEPTSRRLSAAWMTWISGVFMHALTLALLPALLWRTLAAKDASRTATLPRVGALGYIVIVITATSIAAVGVGYLVPGIFVPLTATSESTYSVLSGHHISDVLNLIIFCAPLGAVGVLVWMFKSAVPAGTSENDRQLADGSRVLSVAAISLWLFAFWVDPLIGAFRDWDLFCAFGIPMSVWGGVLLLRRQRREASRPLQWIVLAVFAIGHTGVFIWSARDEIASALRVDRLVGEDVHYSDEFHKGERLVSWADILTRRLGRHDLAKAHNLTRLSYEYRHSTAWRNLAMNYWNLGQPDSAMFAQSQAAKFEPMNAVRWRELALLGMKTGDLECIRGAYEILFTLEDTSYSERNTLASVYIDLGLDSLATPLLSENIGQFPTRFEAHYLSGILAERAGNDADAIEHYEQAINLGGTLADLKLRLSRLSTEPDQ